MTKREKIIFFSLLALAVVLLFFRLGRADMLGDDGHYAFRALGYYDYLGSKTQTTPVQWFGDRPWWSFLGFHDHPFLFFLLDFLVLKLLGASVTATRVLPALAAFLTVVVIYFLGRRLLGPRAGALAGFALVLNTYFIWTGRIGLLESLFVFWLALGVLYLVKALQQGHKYFIWAGLFLGLAFLSKYTLLLAVPGLVIYLLWQQRQVFASKEFWLGVLIFVIVSLPIFIYNGEMYRHRGHFDVQFSDLFHQQHQDWTLLSNRIVNNGYHPWGVLSVLAAGFSWPYFLLFLVAFGGCIYLAVKTKNSLIYLPLLIFLSFWGFFSWLGAAPRWLGVMAPFAALPIGIFVDSWFGKWRAGPVKILLLALLGGLAVFALFYNLNTNHFLTAVGNQFWYANFRVENYGYNQLDQKVASLLRGQHADATVQDIINQWWFRDIRPAALPPLPSLSANLPFDALVVYDSNTSWFATVWMFDRWRFYNRLLTMPTENYFQILSNPQAVAALRDSQISDAYFILSSPRVAEAAQTNFTSTQNLQEIFARNRSVPEVVTDDMGRPAFYIYHQSLHY